jgi:hypothetical protein
MVRVADVKLKNLIMEERGGYGISAVQKIGGSNCTEDQSRLTGSQRVTTAFRRSRPITARQKTSSTSSCGHTLEFVDELSTLSHPRYLNVYLWSSPSFTSCSRPFMSVRPGSSVKWLPFSELCPDYPTNSRRVQFTLVYSLKKKTP